MNSNAITRFNVELSKLPVSADIFTQAFIDDIGATNVEGMVVGNSAGAGLSAIDAANATAQQGDHVAHNYIQLRGFDTSVMQRDSLMPVGPLFNPGSTAAGETSLFDVERVEVIDGTAVPALQRRRARRRDQRGLQDGLLRPGAHRFTALSDGSIRLQGRAGGPEQGNDRVAVRVALLDQDTDTRRVNVGQQIDGEYLQLAVKPFRNTTIRLDLEQTVEHAQTGDPGVSLSAVTGDGRAGLALSYLLATNQTGANTVNPSDRRPQLRRHAPGRDAQLEQCRLAVGLAGGRVHPEHVRDRHDRHGWSPDISTELAFGYSASDYAFRAGAATLYAPTSSTNTTGTWAFGVSPSETDEPAVNKAIRFSIVDSADLQREGPLPDDPRGRFRGLPRALHRLFVLAGGCQFQPRLFGGHQHQQRPHQAAQRFLSDRQRSRPIR